MRTSTAMKLPSDPSDDPSDDPTFYPVQESLGEDRIQRSLATTFQPLLQRYFDQRGIVAYAGADQFFYYVQGDPKACVSPDVYVVPGFTLEENPSFWTWKKWETGFVPSFALEIMSIHNRKKKDELKSPARHDALGTKELVVVDPYANEVYGLRARRRTRFRIFRRDANDRLVLVEQTNALAIQSQELECHLRLVGRGEFQRLRIATGPNGDHIFPTTAEAEAQRANTEAQRANAAEAELERLRTELANLKRQA